MEDKAFALLEKMYSELVDFKEETRNNFRKLETRIDGEITLKLDALFDGYKANSEKHEELNDKVDNIQFDLNNLNIKVANNDNRMLEIKRNLKNIK